MSRSSRSFVAALFALPLAFATACEGDGGGRGLVISTSITADSCTPIPALSPFPSGLTILSEATGLATVIQLQPDAVVVFDLDADPTRPRIVAVEEIGLDSDGDGLDDADTIEPILGFPLYAYPGSIQAVDDTLALVTTSNYEQVLVVDPTTGLPIEVEIEVPAAIPPERFPLLPPPGASARRTGISTLACVFPPDPVLSNGQPLVVEPVCSATDPSFLTTFTSATAVSSGRLFVTTSNLFRSSRFFPGSLLVFDWIRTPGGATVRPSVDAPFLFTSGYNATGLTPFTTSGGRELVLVTVTGAIGTGSGASNVLTDAFVDVIDPAVPRIVATIPLGLAGPSFEVASVDPAGRIAWLGASSARQAYAVDLRPLDDPVLYAGSGPPVILDGLTVGFDDARVFTADFPLELPGRSDGRSSGDCEGFTDVGINSSGTTLFASDFCDGTLTQFALDLSGTPPVPWPRDRFVPTEQSNPFAPNDAVGEVRAPTSIEARPGVPGVDYATADLLVIVGQPDGQLCGVRAESL
ncbi:MAG: hypothetical protein CL931_13735 [Deltaproteobacteria bacterium]|nr:hypothetical protein [Deltaproteobacteria bacterium]